MTTRAAIVRGPGWGDEVILYRAGDLKLDELITRRYTLDEVNQGYQDMLDGKTIRSVIIHEH